MELTEEQKAKLSASNPEVYGNMVSLDPSSLAYPEILNLLSQGNTEAVAQWLSSKGDIWSQKVSASPSMGINYNHTWLQKLGSAIGFRTGYDKFLEQQQASHKQYIADLLDQYYQQEFNKPVSQVQQMREAGQNPDLLGTQSVQSAPQAATDNDGMDPSAFEGGTFGEFVSSTTSMASAINGVVSMVGSAVEGVFQMMNMSEDLRGKGIANGNALVDMAGKLISEFSPTDLGFRPDDPESFGSDEYTWFTLPKEAFEGANYRNIARNIAAKKLGLRKKDISRVVDLMKEMYPMLGGQNRVHEGQLKYGQVKGANLLAQGNDFINPRGVSVEEQFKFLEPFAKMQQKMTASYFDIEQKMQNLNKRQIQASYATATNELTFQQALDPQLQAESVNMSNELSKLKNEFFKTMQSAQNEMLYSVKRNADSGDRLSKILYFMLISSGFIASTGVGSVIQTIGSTAKEGLSGLGNALRSRNSGNFEIHRDPQFGW